MRGSEEGGRRKGRQARRGRRSGDTALSSCQGSEPFPNRPARHFPSGPQNGFRFCIHSIHLYRGRSGNGQRLCTLSQEVIEFILGRKEMFVCICNAFVCICNVFLCVCTCKCGIQHQRAYCLYSTWGWSRRCLYDLTQLTMWMLET